ncbi:hypothetical protein LCI18_011954 [Fusarium solani-melongenae]|uniref:Uncharacterized protein n=1 Tax=Fusarium solani subsp. cucurbitae TaxID=2747967 RepID=A0ACD3ZI49_FUSSC|nr:hypothetical protein LCI18_011954 [Fusarium solani-melongenae]
MCGRYALALRPSQIRRMLEEDGLDVDDAPEDEGDGTPRYTYNFAPGNHGIVYRANTPDGGAGHQGTDNERQQHAEMNDATDHAASSDQVKYKLQSMKWGLIPSWTKRNLDYGSMLKTINCRDDSLSSPGGMWASMKARKRCIVVAQGFYEWLKIGKDKQPHYVKRKDGHLMCFAGLWDCVQYEGSADKTYTYTVVTTDSNKQLKFLHNRMPVIFNHDSSEIQTWLDPSRNQWSRELQSLLKPFEGELEVYPVTKEVGKVGNNSPSFVIPLDSKENKSNIANFFANAKQKMGSGHQDSGQHSEVKVKEEGEQLRDDSKATTSLFDSEKSSHGKRKASGVANDDEGNAKRREVGKISATQNKGREIKKGKVGDSYKITRFFN